VGRISTGGSVGSIGGGCSEPFDVFGLHLSVATLRVRKYAICRTLAQVGRSRLGSSIWVSNLLKGLAQRQAREPRRVPTWDLGVVLSYLRSSVFEPLGSVPLAQVTSKAIFLVVLASGHRASEVTGLSGLSPDVALSWMGPFPSVFYWSFGPRISLSLSFLPLVLWISWSQIFVTVRLRSCVSIGSGPTVIGLSLSVSCSFQFGLF
jgi:hypothetical protein